MTFELFMERADLLVNNPEEEVVTFSRDGCLDNDRTAFAHNFLAVCSFSFSMGVLVSVDLLDENKIGIHSSQTLWGVS